MIIIMTKTNLQVRIPPELDRQIAKFSSESKSAFVRQAIEEKIQRENFERLEQAWIQALTGHPENTKETEIWLKAESWDSR